MNKTFVMERMDDKETKGCYRYGHTEGDTGVTSIYVRKETLRGIPAARIKVTIEEAS
jgi:hypothetical protein